VMPSDSGGYFTRLQSEMDAVRTTESSLAVAVSRRDEIKSQLRGETAVTATGGATAAGGLGAAAVGGDLNSRIQDAQAKLDVLKERFTDHHPDVIALQQTLDELKARRAAEIESLRRGDINAVASSGAAANPVYQSIQLALNQAELEIATLSRQLKEHKSREEELRAALNTMPKVEAEYAQLNRDYDVNKASYTALLTQLEKARLGQEADSSGSVRFQEIQPPTAEFKPVSPHRAITILAILAAALGAGGAIAYGWSLLNPVFWSINGLAVLQGVRVLGTVSSAYPTAVRGTHRRQFVLFLSCVFALAIVGAAVMYASRVGVRFSLDALVKGAA